VIIACNMISLINMVPDQEVVTLFSFDIFFISDFIQNTLLLYSIAIFAVVLLDNKAKDAHKDSGRAIQGMTLSVI